MRVLAHIIIYCTLIPYLTQARQCKLPKSLKTEIRSYNAVAKKIMDTFTNGKHKGYVFQQLAKFLDKFGPRPVGSKILEDSIDYMVELLNHKKLDNVHTESVMVPHWVRGRETATLLTPRKHNITLLGLGGSIGTPKRGIRADAIVVKSFDELEKVNAKGKIVIFNQPMETYEKSVIYRLAGATHAARSGAIATLVASITPFSMNTPHAGWQNYDPNVTKIPVASITLEDAHMLQRMQDDGEKLTIKLMLESKHLPDAESRNVIADITGKEKPEKIVVVSGHIDSWDVGQGAMDDGGGAFISWIALDILKDLNLTPRKTLRSILYTSEEANMEGAAAYVKEHKNEMDKFEIVLESDEGTFAPTGLDFNGSEEAACILEQVLRLLKPLNATKLTTDRIEDTDAELFSKSNVPVATLLNANENYFWYHHTSADTMDVMDSDALDKCAAVWATIAYILADLSVPIPKNDMLKLRY